MKIKCIGIVANKDKQDAVILRESLCEWLTARGVDVFFARVPSKQEAITKKMKSSDLLVVLGGDGTILKTARVVSKMEIPIVGINLGGLGYMTEININEMLAAMEKIIAGDFTVQRRMMLDVAIDSKDSVLVLNDAVINRGNHSRMVEIETFVDNTYLTTFRADGLIVSTPTGSTAYSLSAGGPIVTPNHNCIIINPICPHTLTNRPIIFSPDAAIEMRVRSKSIKDTGALLVLDGQETFFVNKKNSIAIKKASNDALLVSSPLHNYFEILRSKLAWSLSPSLK